MSEDEPKIIVDDDWKSQVEQEKEQLAKQEAEADSPDSADAMRDLPPASFPILVSTISTQALAALGFINDPASGKPIANPVLAKHFIDTLGVLEEKTKGNLTDDEELMLTETLHQLRIAFVASKQQPLESGAAEPEKPSSIELP